MKVLVTGGTGFIGSHLTERLVKEGMDVVIPVRQSSDKRYIPPGSVETIEAEGLASGKIKGLLNEVDVVFHLASIRGSGWSFDDEKVHQINVGITENLLKASENEGVGHFIYVSSVSVYGHPKGGPVDESHPCTPVTRYGKTKHESEKLVREYHAEAKLPTTILRPVITYGPRDAWGMIPKLVTLIHSKRYLTVGKGENRVHLIYIDDLIEGMMLAVKNPGPSGNDYILAGEEPVTINRLVDIISSALNRKAPGLHIPIRPAQIAAAFLEFFYRLLSVEKEPFVTRDKIDIMCRDRFFSPGKAKKDLGFAPKVGYEEGLKRTIGWMYSVEQIKG